MSSFRTVTSLVLFLFVIPSFSSSLSFIIGLIVSTTAGKHWGAADISSEIAVCYFVWSPWRSGARFYSCWVNVLRNYFFACIVPNRVFCRGHFLLSRADRAANGTFYTSCRHFQICCFSLVGSSQQLQLQLQLRLQLHPDAYSVRFKYVTSKKM